MENAITQAIRDNPFEVQAAMNLLEITIQERNDKIENIRIKSAEKVNDILQRHQSAIDDINARLERIERDRQRVFRRIEAVEEAERNAVQAAAAREAAREAALAERTPSPSQEDMLRWHHWSS
jgi:Tfp pilus assembly protein PilN